VGKQSAQQAAAATNTANAQSQLQWAKNQATTNQATTDQAVTNDLNTQNQLSNSSSADRTAYENTMYPALANEVKDAATYASPGKKDLDVGAAQANVAQQFDAARNNSTQALESYGVNPASTRFGALDIGTRTAQAAAQAAAGTTASNNVDATARALNHQVVTDSAPLANQSTNEATAGTAAGTSAVNNATANTASGASTMGTGAQWSGLANSADAGAASTINSGYANQLDATKTNNAAAAQNNSTSSGIGSALGLAASVAMAASGGAIGDPDATPGGAVPVHASPTGGKAIDDVPARLTVGEFVIPKDVTAWKGQEHFQKLIEQSRKAAAHAGAKPTVAPAVGGPSPAPAFKSTPQQGAIPMSRAA
jgi:hypothetical protein